MKTLIIYPYKLTSQSGRALKDAFETKMVKPDGNYVYNPQNNEVVLNYGNSTIPIWENENVQWLNQPNSIVVSVNKLLTFNRLKESGVSIPEYTESKEVALEWVKSGKTVIARELLTSHSGKGCVVCDTEEKLQSVDAPLYTLYFKRKREFRVHILKGVVFDIAEKRKESGIPEEQVNTFIRSFDNHWIFCRKNLIGNIPQSVLDVAIQAATALNLDLCSVDIGYNEYLNKSVCFEANTSSGLMGDTTVNRYVKALTEYLSDQSITPWNQHKDDKFGKQNQHVDEVEQIKPAPAAETQEVQQDIKDKEEFKTEPKSFDLSDFSNIVLKLNNGTIEIYGKIGSHKVKALEIKGSGLEVIEW